MGPSGLTPAVDESGEAVRCRHEGSRKRNPQRRCSPQSPVGPSSNLRSQPLAGTHSQAHPGWRRAPLCILGYGFCLRLTPFSVVVMRFASLWVQGHLCILPLPSDSSTAGTLLALLRAASVFAARGWPSVLLEVGCSYAGLEGRGAHSPKQGSSKSIWLLRNPAQVLLAFYSHGHSSPSILALNDASLSNFGTVQGIFKPVPG